MNQEIEARIVNSYWTRANFLIFTKLSTLWTIEAYSVRMEPISFYPHSTLLLQQSFPFLKLKKIPLPHFSTSFMFIYKQRGESKWGILWGLNSRKRGQYYEEKGGFLWSWGVQFHFGVSHPCTHSISTVYTSSGPII